MYVGVFGRQITAVDIPRKIPPNVKFNHPSAMYPGEALNSAQTNEGTTPKHMHITISSNIILALSPL